MMDILNTKQKKSEKIQQYQGLLEWLFKLQAEKQKSRKLQIK